MKTSSLRLPGLRFVLPACAVLLVGAVPFLGACRKADSASAAAAAARAETWTFRPQQPPDWSQLAFADAHGRRWSNLILNETDSPAHIGFRARYTLTEPELELIGGGLAWRQSRAREFISFDLFLSLDGDISFVRAVRPVGSAGWVTGIFVRQAAEQTPPAQLLRHTGFVVQKPSLQSSMVEPVFDGGGQIGAVVADYPDGGARRGTPRAELQNARAVTLDIDAPDFEAGLRAQAAKKLAKIEEKKLPWPIQRLPVAQRPEMLARLAVTSAAIKTAFPGRLTTVWEGTLPLSGRGLPVVARITYDHPQQADSPMPGALSIEVAPRDGKAGGRTVSMQGGLDSEPGPTMLSHFKLNPHNLGEGSDARLAKAFADMPDPFESRQLLANCLVRIVNAETLELSAVGIPAFTLKRKR